MEAWQERWRKWSREEMERADGTGRMRMRTRTRIRTGKSHTGRQIGRQAGRQAGAGAGEVQQQRQRQHIDLLNKGGYKPVGSRGVASVASLSCTAGTALPRDTRALGGFGARACRYRSWLR